MPNRLRAAARRLADPQSTEYLVAATVATGLIGLVPGNAGRGVRAVGLAATAGLTAAVTWVELRERHDVAQWSRFRAVMTACGGALGAVTYPIAERIDTRMEQGLRASGVVNPRPVLALANAGAMALTIALGRATASQEPTSLTAGSVAPLDPRAAELAALLIGAEDIERDVLARQLRHAGSVQWTDGVAPFTGEIEFALPDGLPLTVPRHFTHPASARFVSTEGVEFRLDLTVAAGRLCLLTLVPSDERIANDVRRRADALARLGEWPSAKAFLVDVEH